MTSPQTFHPFPHLATELRLKIWSEYQAHIPPRIIKIYHLNTIPYKPTESRCENLLHIYHNRQSIPAILHVNREAREFGLSIYVAGFSPHGCEFPIVKTQSPEGYMACEHEYGPGPRGEGFLYWDPNKDIMSLEWDVNWRENKARSLPWAKLYRLRIPPMVRPIRWLLLPDRTVDDWVSRQDWMHHRAKDRCRDDVWLGAEIIFVELDVSDVWRWYESWDIIDDMYEYHHARKEKWEKMIKSWVSGQVEKVPEVELLFHASAVGMVKSRLNMS